jgi:hypothetical protein
MAQTTYSIRLGDDARWTGTYTKSEVLVAAMELADSKFGNAVVRNNTTGEVVGRIREMRWVTVADEIRWY